MFGVSCIDFVLKMELNIHSVSRSNNVQPMPILGNPAPIMGTVANTFERYNLTNRCNKFMLFTQIYLTQLFLHLLLKKIDR